MGCFFFSFFCFRCKKTGRGNEATGPVFAIGNCESCTRPISTNPESMEAGVYGLTRGMSRRSRSRSGRGRRAAVDIVVCFGWGGFFVIAFFDFFSSNAHGLLQV